MIENLEQTFKKFDNEFLKFDAVKNKRSLRPDLHAFMLIDDLVPDTSNIITAAEHDEIWLNVNADVLGRVATEDHICELVRCGVWYSHLDHMLAMYV